jgi:hypothetical protein
VLLGLAEVEGVRQRGRVAARAQRRLRVRHRHGIRVVRTCVVVAAVTMDPDCHRCGGSYEAQKWAR